MSKKKYLKPQISIIVFEPLAILAGSGLTSSGFTPNGEIKEGDHEDWEE